MKILSSFKYQLADASRAVMAFWGIVFAVLVLAAFVGSGDAEIRGMEMATVIFMFVAGLNSFRSGFYFSMANGISRKSQFIGFIATISVISAIMAAFDALYALIFSNAMPYSSLFVQLYFSKSPVSYSDNLLSGPAWSILMYIMAAMLGYMISLIYYRSGLALKLAVSIAPPVILFILFPYAAMLYPAHAERALQFVGKALGLFPVAAPTNAMLTFLLCALFFAAASYLLMRRAEIKK